MLRSNQQPLAQEDRRAENDLEENGAARPTHHRRKRATVRSWQRLSSSMTHVLQPACSGVTAIEKAGSRRHTRAPSTHRPGFR